MGAAMTDHMHPQSPTWARAIPEQPSSILDAPASWRAFASRERDPVLAAEYRRLADTLDRYLAMKRGTP